MMWTPPLGQTRTKVVISYPMMAGWSSVGVLISYSQQLQMVKSWSQDKSGDFLDQGSIYFKHIPFKRLILTRNNSEFGAYGCCVCNKGRRDHISCNCTAPMYHDHRAVVQGTMQVKTPEDNNILDWQEGVRGILDHGSNISSFFSQMLL